MLPNPIKLIIWDLDDTFWTGTLTEGGVSVPQSNVDLVIALAKRGIVSSICSKNNFDEARAVLEQHGVWSYFVFPRIEFAPKGVAIATLIEQMALRPDNVLFLDDNRLNLEEARHYAPTLMVAHPNDILPTLLDLPQAKGKDDSALTRLQQYKQLEKKADDFAGGTLSNVEFLRECDVRVQIDIDIESHFERVIELINRSNQLNFTKVRVENPKDREAFKKLLGSYGIHAGIVRVADKYGDYGIVGFFMGQRNAAVNKLMHFVFSCRTMNMGIEQYVYEMLGEPEIKIVGPISNGLKTFDKIDWIRAATAEEKSAAASDAKLLLVGGCDLLQVATWCSANRVEYVNKAKDGFLVRYDDLGFLLSPREAVAACSLLSEVPCWSQEDTLRFDADLADAGIIIVSMWDTMLGDFVLLDGQVLARLGPFALANFLERQHDDAFWERCKFVRLTTRQKVALLERALARIVRLSPNARARFLLGTNTRAAIGRKGATQPGPLRHTYNRAAATYCEREGGFEFISVDEIVPQAELISSTHYTRKGYHGIASIVIDRINRLDGGPVQDASGKNVLQDVIGRAEVLTRSGMKLIGTSRIVTARSAADRRSLRRMQRRAQRRLEHSSDAGQTVPQDLPVSAPLGT